MYITLFKSLVKVDVPFHRGITFALDRIKKGSKSLPLIVAIRLESDKGVRNEYKKRLPCYCFGGTFSSRSSSSLIESSGLATIDIDNLTDEHLTKYKSKLKKDPFVFSCFISPSGNGLKVLVKIPTVSNSIEYKSYFNTFTEYLQAIGIDNVDKATSDLSRVCFESYDPKLFVNHDSQVWDVQETPDITEIGSMAVDIPLTSEHLIVEKLLKWFDAKYSMASGERNVNLFKLVMAFNDFGVNKSTAASVAGQYQTKDFKHSEIETITNSAYNRGVSTFGSKFFEDTAKRDEVQKAIRNGYSFDRIQTIFPEKSKKEVAVIIEKQSEAVTVDKFWSIDKNGKPSLVPHKYKYWLQSHGFFKHYPKDGDIYSFIRKQNNIIEDTNEKKIKDFVLEYLLKEDSDGYLIYDFMAKASKYFSFEFLSFLDTEMITFKKDDKDNCNLFFSNGMVKINRDQIDVIDYVDVDAFVWRNQLIDRQFLKVSKSKGDFEKFVELISGDDGRFLSIRSILGFMLHSYVTSANNKAIIINDETISENPNGGSGKSLLASSLRHLKKYVSIDGKSFEFEKTFAYQTVGLDTQVIVFNDVKRNFDFEKLFSAITEGLTIEYKNQGAVTLPISDNPKYMITTNYTIKGKGGSHDRRKFEVELSDYFNPYRTPLDEFGRMLFDDFNDKDWLEFDSFMVSCIQLYLKEGLIKSEFKNLKERKFITNTSYEFYEWTNDDPIPIDTRLYVSEYYEDFLQNYSDQRKFVSIKRFKGWIESYALEHGFNIFKGRTNNKAWVELSRNEETTVDEFDQITEKAPF